MTASELKYRVEQTGSHFFDRATMRHFGDTMRNYGVRGPLTVTQYDATERTVYELYRRRPVKHGLQKSAYFDAETFKQVQGVN